MNELMDIPVFLWPAMLYPLSFCFQESGESTESKSGRKEGCLMKKILSVALPAALIVLPAIMLIRKRRMA